MPLDTDVVSGSRYAVTRALLKKTALSLQLGAGISDRMSTSMDVPMYVQESEDWADSQVDLWVATPLKPIKALGQTTALDVDNLTYRNYPADFIQAILYHAVARILGSEFFENAPNKSEASSWAEELSWEHLKVFRSKATTLVGAGRRRNPNPFAPPNIAPMEEPDKFNFRRG